MKNGSCNAFMSKQLILSICSIVLIGLAIGSVLGVTANIGNARMILKANIGDTIQKTILVKNINNETITINMTASGDLEKDITILDNNFTLAPGEEKNARFTIKVTKSGAFENRINVFFFSLSEQKGVALSSNIVVMVNTGDNLEDMNDTGDAIPDDNPTLPDDANDDSSDSKTNPMMILLSITGIILLVFFIVLIVYYFKNNKNYFGESLVDNTSNDSIKKENSGEEKKGKGTKQKKSAKRHV